MGEKEFLKVSNVFKAYGSGESRQEVLRGMDFAVSKGEFCVLLGPSGSGKSTLLRCATFLEKIDGGSICYKGEVVAHTNEAGKAVYASNALTSGEM